MRLLFQKKPEFTEVDPYKMLINIGCLMDIPVGSYVRGQKGENLMNGGFSNLVAIAGKGNTFKSTIAHYMFLSAASKMAASGLMPYLNTYDTEMNISLDRLNRFAQIFPEFEGFDLHKEGVWSVTDKTLHLGNEWFKILKDFLRETKIKNKKSFTFETPFIDKDGKPIHMLFPTFGEVDSISEFETADIEEMQNKNEIGTSGGNTIHMRAGLAKTRLLMELPGLCNQTGHYMIMTAHVGKEGPDMNASPMSRPTKTLQHMKSGEAIKGVTGKFFFLPTAVWQTASSTLLNNQGTKGPEYPRLRNDPDPNSSDLNIVTIRMLRSKFGPSGVNLKVIVSQTEGVLPSLTEFHFLKEDCGRYGIEGSLQNYNMVLYPNVKLQRTTVRSVIDSDPLLRRAIKITADLAQIATFYKTLPFAIPPIEDLYKKLEEEYGWDILLQTRDFWTFNHYDHPVPYLSTLDLLEMYHGLYIPYWWCPKTKTVKSPKKK